MSKKDYTSDLVKKTGSENPRELLDNLPVISEPRCNVCKSDFRQIIDRMIAGPYSYAAIARQFIGKDEHFRGDIRNKRDLDRVRKSIERHAKSHVTIRDASIRQIIEQQAREAGILVDDQKNQLLTTQALLELYVSKGFEQVTKEGTWVRHQDVLEAVKMIEEMKRDTVNEQIDVLKRQVAAISQAVRECVPPDLHPQIGMRAKEIFDGQVLELEAAR